MSVAKPEHYNETAQKHSKARSIAIAPPTFSFRLMWRRHRTISNCQLTKETWLPLAGRETSNTPVNFDLPTRLSYWEGNIPWACNHLMHILENCDCAAKDCGPLPSACVEMSWRWRSETPLFGVNARCGVPFTQCNLLRNTSKLTINSFAPET